VNPTVNPTISIAPSECPSQYPTSIPSLEPSEAQVGGRRLLAGAIEDANKFSIFIDGIDTQHTFQFKLALTPTVLSISPRNISSAITTLVSIKGFGFGENAIVTIGNTSCNVMNASDIDINCV